MLRNARLRDAELFPDNLCETTGGAFAAGEEFQDPAPHRIPKNVKSMHGGPAHFSFGQYRKQWSGQPPRAHLVPKFLLRLRRGTILRCFRSQTAYRPGSWAIPWPAVDQPLRLFLDGASSRAL
jgi:hypothetical protein